MDEHSIRYEQDTQNDWVWRAVCTCGWSSAGSLRPVFASAAEHFVKVDAEAAALRDEQRRAS
jgi:hypothetical protein